MHALKLDLFGVVYEDTYCTVLRCNISSHLHQENKKGKTNLECHAARDSQCHEMNTVIIATVNDDLST